MKFEKITDITIKIILSDEDMKLNNVSAENIFSNSASSKMFLQKLLNKAEKEIGFEPGDSRLLVEAIMSSDIEYTFTITKFDDNKMYLEKSNNLFIFKFTYFDDFVALCNFLQNFSLIYYNNTYYLKFIKTKDFSVALDFIQTFFDEFGENVSNSPNIDGFLNEYGKIIFSKDAILKCLFSFVQKKHK